MAIDHGLNQLQQIVNDATELCEVPFVLLSLFEENSNTFKFTALGGVTNPLLQTALKAGKSLTGQDFLSYRHGGDVNSFIQRVTTEKTAVFADFRTAAENILPPAAVDAAQLILKIKQIAGLPIISGGKILGLAGFVSQREISAKNLKLMTVFSNEIKLLIENLQLAANLEKKIKELEEFCQAVESREIRMASLEEEIARLRQRSGR